VLVADDQTLVHRAGGEAIADAPDPIAGRIEVRGVGIAHLPHVSGVPLQLAVSLTESVDRLPRPSRRRVVGVALPELALDPRPASAPIKVELALAQPGMVVA
jgi:serine kinase of HPr protein (carbohydrate metabolism regulator)